MSTDVSDTCSNEGTKLSNLFKRDSSRDSLSESSSCSYAKVESSEVSSISVSSEIDNLCTQKMMHSASYGVSRNLKTILRKTSEMVYLSKRPFPDVHAGPLTYVQSFKDIISYFADNEILPSLSSLCQKLQQGLPMQRISRRKQVLYLFKLENEEAITWKAGSKRLELDSIKDIRIGRMASNYREEYGVSEKVANQWITIIYAVSNKLKALHVVAKNENDFNTFLSCVCGLTYTRRELMESISVPDNEKFANIHWRASVSDRKEDELKDTLTFEDVTRLCDRFHIYCSLKHLKKLFSVADINQNGLLNFQEFQAFVKLLKRRPEITSLWDSLTGEGHSMDFDGFYHVIKDVQNEDIDRENARIIFERFCGSHNSVLDENDFIKFLGAQPYMKKLSEDYSKPLNNYFIASSHNTYLLGKQVGETPSVEGYVQALQQGCRCIEIDIWDDDMGPVVCHGFLTGAIPLVNVAEIIRKYAFITSPYPLIISLEINCNTENQIIASSIFQNSLGSMLVRSEFEESGDLPSPKELMHKIILKGKKNANFSLGAINQDNALSAESTSSCSSFDSEAENMGKAVERKSSTRMRRIRRMTISKHVEVCDSVLEICGLFGLKFRNFSLPASKTSNHCFSLNEKKFDSMCKDKTQVLSLDKHNRKYLMRVYPYALRYKSSNFNPIKYWKMGAQMVATNWQTYDLGQQINLAMFQLSNQKNGVLHSGYVLKPPSLIPKVAKVQELPSLYKKMRRSITHINLKVLSAQLLPKPSDGHNGKELFAPYVTVEFIIDEEPISPVGVTNGSKISATTASTSFCKENGLNPSWDTEMSLLVKSLDFAFVRFTVKTNEIILATSCFKVEYLRTGYRHIPLYNVEGEVYIFSTLFIFLDVH
ncbi:hypothetical protein HG535_0G03130 [Zygotorulaspora mrakii]|uniref:Phosphoinositide phospholipase C n=1 Tax=Zygotorulaspora mrakii TaxID=42260 RepID=A0A7H9B7C1_ZYGMR|nr:uncharacterized protein HG535_0G03130 [Zygotorulaspora mrakii]QLG74430.1 hypothetical protein HG535_0G03130 [Zygotorulaspora mrakii]